MTIPNVHKFIDGGVRRLGTVLQSATHYVGEYNRTYVVYSSPGTPDSANHIIIYFDHNADTWSSPVKVAGSYENDLHSNPSLQIDNDGYLYVFYDRHEYIRVKRSTYPEDTSSWRNEVKPCTYATYPMSVVDSSNKIYFFHMHGPNGSDSRNLVVQTSTDRGLTWSNEKRIVSVTGKRCYTTKVIIDPSDTIHVTWSWEVPDTSRRENVYYIKSSDGCSTWQKADGTNQTIPVNQYTCDKAFNSGGEWCQARDLVVDKNNYPIITYNNDYKYGIARWTGSAWVNHPLGVGTSNHWGSCTIDVIDSTTYDGWLDYNYVASSPYGGDIQRWRTHNSGATWAKAEDVTTGGAGTSNTYFGALIPQNHSIEVKSVFLRIMPDNDDYYYYGTPAGIISGTVKNIYANHISGVTITANGYTTTTE